MEGSSNEQRHIECEEEEDDEDEEEEEEEQELKFSWFERIVYRACEDFGEFAHSAAWTTPLPLLNIANYGIVGLPVTERAARDLEPLFHAAPHGRGQETVVDEKVRRTLELDDCCFGRRILQMAQGRDAFLVLLSWRKEESSNAVQALAVSPGGPLWCSYSTVTLSENRACLEQWWCSFPRFTRAERSK